MNQQGEIIKCKSVHLLLMLSCFAMLTPQRIRVLPEGFAFEAASGREIKGAYEPNGQNPETLWLCTIARLSDGSSFLVGRSFPIQGKLSVEELAAKGENLDAEARKKELG